MRPPKPARESLPAEERPSEAERDRLLARVVFEAIWERDLRTGAFSWVAGLDMFGYRHGEAVDDFSWWRDRIHPDDRESVLASLEETLAGDAASWAREYRFRRRDDRWAWIAGRGVVERDQDGLAVRAAFAMMDVSRMKEMETSLRLFAEQLPARIGAAGRDLTILWDMGAGFPEAGKFAGKSVADIFAGSPDLERMLAVTRKVLAGESCKLEVELASRTAEVQLEPFRDHSEQIVGVVGVALDVTERALAEKRLRETQRMLLEAQRIGQVRAWEEDLASGMLTWDLAAMAGPSGRRAQIPPEEAWKSVHPQDGRRLIELRKRTLETGNPFETEYRTLTADGSERIMLLRGELIRDAAGRPERLLGTTLDITEHKRAEQALRKSQLLLRLVLDTLPVGVAVLDTGGDILLANAASAQIWGGTIRSGKERWGRSAGVWRDSGRQIGPGEWPSERALSQGQTRLNELIDIETYDGKHKTIQNSTAPIRDEGGAIVGAVVVNEEVTERTRAGEELARQTRQQAAIAQISLSALAGDEVQPVLEEAVKLVAQTLRVDHCMVLEALPDQSGLVFRAGEGPWKEELRRGATLEVAPGFMNWFSLQARTPVVVDDLVEETRFFPYEVLLEHGVKSGINVPIHGRERPFGVLGAHSTTPRRFTEDEVNFVWSVANVLATSIEQKRTAAELAEQREQLQSLSRKLIRAQEAERRAVARELHDDFGQVLTAIKLNLQKREGDTEDSIALVDGAIARVRELAQDLRPPLLDDLGLESSLRSYVEREASRAGLEIALDLASLAARPSAEVEITCFRVAQEALTNVIRHAQARRVEVRLRPEGNELLLEVRDDGTGFDVAKGRKRALGGASQGLLNMQERVALAGGALQIESAAGRGTTVSARLPLTGGGGP